MRGIILDFGLEVKEKVGLATNGHELARRGEPRISQIDADLWGSVSLLCACAALSSMRASAKVALVAHYGLRPPGGCPLGRAD